MKRSFLSDGANGKQSWNDGNRRCALRGEEKLFQRRRSGGEREKEGVSVLTGEESVEQASEASSKLAREQHLT